MNIKANKILIALALFGIFLISYHPGFLKFVDRFFSLIFAPTNAEIIKLSSQTNRYLLNANLSKSDLQQRVGELQNEVNNLRARILEIESVEKENIELRALLNFPKQTAYRVVVANIIYKNNSALQKTVVISKGAKNGLKSGQAVISGTGILLGKVETVGMYQSIVKLSIDDNTNILATLEGLEHNIAGVLNGRQGTSLVLNLIPRNIDIIPGQKVLTNGLQENIPADLYLGRVIKLQESDNEIFNSALVEVPYIIEDLTVAAVLIAPEN